MAAAVKRKPKKTAKGATKAPHKPLTPMPPPPTAAVAVAPFPQPKAADAGLVTRATLAAIFEVPPARIGQWLNDGMPVSERGKRGEAALYDPEAVRAWRAARARDSELNLSLEAERAKLTREQRMKVSRENRVAVGELVKREDVVAEARAGVLAIRTRLLQLPRQLGQAGIVPRERELEATAVINDALRELSSWRWVKEDVAEAAAS